MKITLTAPVECPQCGAKVRGEWDGDHRNGQPQDCPRGHQFTADWPGFPFDPPTIIADAIAVHANERAAAHASVHEHAGEAGNSREPGANCGET